jgi:hypothetical protein
VVGLYSRTLTLTPGPSPIPQPRPPPHPPPPPPPPPPPNPPPPPQPPTPTPTPQPLTPTPIPPPTRWTIYPNALLDSKCGEGKCGDNPCNRGCSGYSDPASAGLAGDKVCNAMCFTGARNDCQQARTSWHHTVVIRVPCRYTTPCDVFTMSMSMSMY